MSHQTKYKSTFVSMVFVTKAMLELGFTLHSEQTRNKAKVRIFEKAGCHIVTASQVEGQDVDISTDLHWGDRSTQVIKALGEDCYNLATEYNTIQMTEHFESQGYQVESVQENGERMLVVNVEGGY